MYRAFYKFKFANSRLLWCIITLFALLTFTMKVDCNDGTSKSVIALPKAENGIEKIEYMVNGEAKGSTNGINSVELEPGSKITFAVKFQSEGYGKLHVRNIKIKSENGSVLRLNTYAKDDDGNFVLMRVQDSEVINPKQTYISSDYIVTKDDKLSFEGIDEDKYRVKIADENNDVNLSDAVKLKYSDNGANYIDAQFSENENAYVINNLTKSSNVKLMFEIKEGYTDSDLSLVNGENQIAIDSKSKTCTLPILKDDTNLEIRNLEKNSYSVTFSEYTNAKFSCRIAGTEDEFTSSETIKVNYGDNLEIKCETQSDDILESGKVTANGKVLPVENGIYTLENIKDHHSIAITPKANAVYTLSLPENESRIKLCDTFGNEISEINAKENETVNFKLIPTDAYRKNFILAEMYAVPMSKLSDGNYDTNANPEEAKSFLMIPMGNYVYTLKNISEPMKIIANKMEKNTYTVTLPEKIIGANAEVELNENITKLTENKFKVVHGSDLVVNLEAQAGYDLSTMNVGDVNNSVEIVQEGNKYTFKNIESDKHLIITGASAASCKVSFDGNGVVATNESGSAWKNNTALIKYEEGTLKFKVYPANGASDSEEDITLSIKSGSGKLEKVASEKNTYSLSDVTDDIVLSANETENSDVTITLKSDDDDIEFTDANDENIVLPEENTVKYGSDLNFKVVSKSGKSTDNASVLSSVSNPITTSNTSSNTYSVRALRSGATLASTGQTDSRKYGHYINLCETLHAVSSTYDKAFEANLYKTFDDEIPSMVLVFSKDPEACECINSSTEFLLDKDELGQPDVTVHQNNFTANPSTDTYTIPLSVPSLLTSNNLPLQGIPLNINFQKLSRAVIGHGIETSYHTISEIFPASLYTNNIVSNREIPNEESSVPNIGLREANIGEYYATTDFGGQNIPAGSIALTYLEDCYCQSFTELYPDVNFVNNLTNDASHSSGISFRDLVNINDYYGTFRISTDCTPHGGTTPQDIDGYLMKFHPVTAKFKIYLDEDKKFVDGVENPLCLNNGAHAKLTQQVVQDETKSYVDCELTVTPFDEKIELNWSADSTVEKRQHTITFNPNGGIFKNSQNTETTSDKVDYKNGMIFYTEPTTGYEYGDSLTVQKDYTLYDVGNITKISFIDGEETESYNGEWIKLSENSLDSGLFIRGFKENSKIKYEIAGSTESISEYIEKTGSGSDAHYIKRTVSPGQPIIPQGIISDLKITSIRILRTLSVTFSYAEGIEYTEIDGETPIPTEPQPLNYGEALAFKIKPKMGYDISNIQVTASTAGNSNILPLTNGMYIIVNVTEPTTISVNNVQKSNITLSFEQYEGVKFKNTSGVEYPIRQQLPYDEEFIFQIEVDEAHSQNAGNVKVYISYLGGLIITKEFADSPDPENPRPYIKDNLYIIPGQCINGDIKITISKPDVNTYNVSLKPSGGIKYYDIAGDNTLPENNSGITYGNSFKFRLKADQGYDASNVEVIANKNTGGSPITITPANGVYTIENITSDYTVTVSGVSKQEHTLEFRTVTGVACIDSYGKTLPSSVTVSDGDSYSFYLSFDSAYSKSKDTADVTIKGTNNKIPKDASGKYTIPNITENKIIEVINVTKNSYTATFVPAEGVVYRTAKGKEFDGTLNVEYGESLYFKISLLDAYDQSIPAVKMNGAKTLVENSGSYILENISDDVTVTVENVKKNPEELTIEDIQNVPNPVANESDVDAVVAATKAYNSLSDDEKKLVTNKQALEKAQSEAGDINHTSNGITISGVDWNIKLIVTPLSDNEGEMNSFAEKVDRRSLLSLYRVELIDLLTGESYSVPYGNEIQMTMPCPDLTGYKNTTVAHENLAENMEYLEPNIVGDTVKISATSVGLFGIAAKEIPNYSEDTSDMSISMGDLVSDDDELKTLLGEDLSSELGHLIDLEDENDGSGNSSSAKDKNKSDGGSTYGNSSQGGSDSVLNSMANGAASLANSAYNWALDNEFLAVITILILGSLLIIFILLSNRKNNKKDDHLEKRD